MSNNCCSISSSSDSLSNVFLHAELNASGLLQAAREVGKRKGTREETEEDMTKMNWASGEGSVGLDFVRVSGASSLLK